MRIFDEEIRTVPNFTDVNIPKNIVTLGKLRIAKRVLFNFSNVFSNEFIFVLFSRILNEKDDVSKIKHK